MHLLFDIEMDSFYLADGVNGKRETENDVNMET